jgi:hypothetical protein
VKADDSSATPRRPARVAATALLVVLSPLPVSAQPAQPADKPAAPARGVVEMSLVDGSTVRATLRDERLEVRTAYGTLLVPAADVQSVEFGRRIPAALAKKIDAAILNLGSAEYKARQVATAELEALGARAYPALVRAAASNDKEVARRAQEVLTKLRESVSEEELERPEHDVIHGGGMRLIGRLTADVLKVSTAAFGEQSVRLADLRALRAPEAAGPGPQEVMADPGDLLRYQGQVGKTFYFRVTGGEPMARGRRGGGGFGPGVAGVAGVGGAVYGSGVYTTDSTLALAAVHAGVLKAGESGVVKVTVLGPATSLVGTTRNGVTSQPFGFYPATYRVSKAGR